MAEQNPQWYEEWRSSKSPASMYQLVNSKTYKENKGDLLKEVVSSIDSAGTRQQNQMFTAVDRLRRAGFSDEEIYNWFNETGQLINGKGFSKTWDDYNSMITELVDHRTNEAKAAENSEAALTNVYSMLDDSYKNYTQDMILNPYGEAAQQYKRDQYAAINEYEASLDRSLAASEMSAYQQIGQQQLELESQISKQRLQALKSGTTSAQLASQQLANMFAAQSGAAQIAGNVMQSRLQNTNAVAQSRLGVTSDLYSMINSNQQAAANVGAQIAAAKANFASTYLQAGGQYNAWEQLSPRSQKTLSGQNNK